MKPPLIFINVELRYELIQLLALSTLGKANAHM